MRTDKSTELCSPLLGSYLVTKSGRHNFNVNTKRKNHVYTVGVAIDGHNNEVKERHIQLVKKRGNVKALDEELYSKWTPCPVRVIKAARVGLNSFIPAAPETKDMSSSKRG